MTTDAGSEHAHDANDPRREILEDLAAGRITPEQAAERLEGTPEPPAAEQPEETGGDAATIKVHGTIRQVRVVGDPSVKEVVVEGPHTVERDGTVLFIRDQPADGDSWFVIRSGRRGGGKASKKRSELSVRMNPALALDARVEAGGLSITDVDGPIKAAAEAGGIRIEGFTRPIDVRVDAGGAVLSGILRDGESKISCSAGGVKLHLERGSSVAIDARASLGKVDLPGSDAGWHIGSGSRRSTIGDGAGRLAVEVEAGAIKVTTDETWTTDQTSEKEMGSR